MASRNFIKSGCLILLSVQNVLHALAMRQSRSANREHFLTSSVLILSETIKLFISGFVLLIEKELLKAVRSIYLDPVDFLRTCVPAVIYVFQNALLFFALSHLDATIFQVTYQVKLLTTAVFSVIFLAKKISSMQWISLVVLFIGVSIVHTSEQDNLITSASFHASDSPIGLISVLGASLLSGFAAVYFEKILKHSTKSLWVRNFELAFASVIIAVLGQLLTESSKLKVQGFFYGFDWLVWSIVFLQSGGGIVVALVVKYADNILKGFACSASIVISCVFSVTLMGMRLSAAFILGTLLVIVSVVMYSSFPESSSTQRRRRRSVE